jgi:cytochrome c oxidase assembly protein subunit 15
MEHIRAAEALMPDGPVTVMKAWIEMIHRYLAMGIGVLIIAIVVISWRFWLRSGQNAATICARFSDCLFLFVCVQGAFGAWTVTMKLATRHRHHSLDARHDVAWHADLARRTAEGSPTG